MKISSLLLVIALLIYNSIFAQQFTIRYNGTGNAADVVKAMVVDNSGNIYVTVQ